MLPCPEMGGIMKTIRCPWCKGAGVIDSDDLLVELKGVEKLADELRSLTPTKPEFPPNVVFCDAPWWPWGIVPGAVLLIAAILALLNLLLL